MNVSNLVVCIIAVTCFSCTKTEKTSIESPNELDLNIYTFPVDNEDPSKFGFVEMDNDIIISVTSICVVNNYVYLADEYHKNIKRIDLLNSNMISSVKITDSTFFKQFSDIVDFNGKLYIPSSEKTIYVISYDFNNLSTFTLPTLGGYPIIAFSKTDSTIDLSVSIRDSLYRVDRNNEVVLKRQLTNKEILRLINFFDLELGNVKDKELKYYKKDENLEFIEVNGKKIKLETSFEYVSDSFNVDFNNSYLVIFNCDDQELKLYVYSLN